MSRPKAKIPFRVRAQIDSVWATAQRMFPNSKLIVFIVSDEQLRLLREERDCSVKVVAWTDD